MSKNSPSNSAAISCAPDSSLALPRSLIPHWAQPAWPTSRRVQT